MNSHQRRIALRAYIRSERERLHAIARKHFPGYDVASFDADLDTVEFTVPVRNKVRQKSDRKVRRFVREAIRDWAQNRTPGAGATVVFALASKHGRIIRGYRAWRQNSHHFDGLLLRKDA